MSISEDRGENNPERKGMSTSPKGKRENHKLKGNVS